MTIYPGDLFSREELSGQASLIQELYMREGYVNPQVEITAEKDPSDGFMVVHVHVKKGAYYTLKLLEIQGNRAFSDVRLKIRMVAWRQSLLPGSSGRFVEKNLQKDVETLTTFYRRKRYPDAGIRLRIERDPTLGEAYALVNIDESSLVIWHFADGSWHMGGTVDEEADTVSLTVDSFSPFSLGVVPEPSVLAILTTVALALLAYARRRRR